MAQSPASFKWLTISIQGHYTWDLWWTMLNWDRILSQYFSFLCQYPATIVPRPFTHLSLTSLGPISRQRRYTQHITRDPLIRIYVLAATDSYWRLLTATDSPGHSWLENLKIRKIWSIVFVTLHVTALSFTCYCVTFYMLLRDVLHVTAWRSTCYSVTFTCYCVTFYMLLRDVLHVTAWRFTCYCVTFYMLLRDVLHVTAWRFTGYCVTFYMLLRDVLHVTAWRFTCYCVAFYMLLRDVLHVTTWRFTCYCVTFTCYYVTYYMLLRDVYVLLRDVLHVAVWRFTRAVWHVQPTILYQHASRLLEDTCRSVLEASRNYNSVSAIDGPHRDVLT